MLYVRSLIYEDYEHRKIHFKLLLVKISVQILIIISFPRATYIESGFYG